MTVYDELLEANKNYARTFNKGDLRPPPRRRIAVITCMDARLRPEQFLGLELGDAHIIRNAGGRASDDAIRSIVISQCMLGTNEIIVIHHTDCGLATVTNEQLSNKIKQELGVDTQGLDFLTFTSSRQSVCDDVTRLRESPLIAKDCPISGAIYDVRTGILNEVVRA